MAKVLIAEDDKFLANAYRVKLTKAGFDVVIASNGEDTLNLVKKERPDIILLDLIMPQVDGFAVLESLKNDPILKKIPVIVASNLGQQEDINKAKNLGADDYIIKSDMSLEGIIKKINSYL